MGSGLFSSLFTYRPREGRTPLEEFTSAGLVDILNRLTGEEQLAFLNCFEQPSGSPPFGWEIFCQGDRRLSWKAEFPVEGKDDHKGRADLIAFDCDSSVRIIIENKISAEVSPQQMQVYDSALNKTDGKSIALLFLSHTTTPPEQFMRYTPSVRTIFASTRWKHLARWLRTLAAANPVVAALADEFCIFLSEQGVLKTVMTPDSFATLNLFLTQKPVIENTIMSLLEPMQEELGQWISRRQNNPINATGVFGLWNNMPNAEVADAWFGACLVYPALSDWWLPTPDKNPQFVIYLAAGSEPGWPDIKAEGWSWNAEDGELIATTAALEILLEPINAEAHLRQWARQRCVDAAAALIRNGGG